MAKSNNSGNNIIKQGSILAAASVISRIIGMLYRSPMSAAIGDEGNALYSFAFEIYSIALILSSYSMPLAVSKLLSGRFARREYKNGMKILYFSMVFSIVSGTIMMLLIFFGAGLIENLSGYAGVRTPLRVLAPTILLVAIAGTLRGFFQSRSTMMPTAVSQLIEQIVNAVISIAAAFIFVHIFTSGNDKARWGAAGGTLGTLFGAVSSVCFLIFLYTIYKPRMMKHVSHDPTGLTLTTPEIVKSLFYTIIPIILSQTVYQAIGVIDGFMFGNMYEGEAKSVLYGIYSSKYRLMVNVPNAISSALASSMIPTLVSLFTLGKLYEFKERLASTIKFNMIIAFPCAMGLSALSTRIMILLFPTTETVISGKMLLFGSIAVVFYALSTATNAALQGMDKMRAPVIHASVSLAIHVVLMIVLLKFTNLGAFALVIGNITYPLVICILNWIAISRLHYRQEVLTTFLIPAGASAIMWIVIYLLNLASDRLLPSGYIVNAVITVFLILIAVMVYFFFIFVFKGLTREELREFPMGTKIIKLADKFRLLK